MLTVRLAANSATYSHCGQYTETQEYTHVVHPHPAYYTK